MGGGGGMAPDGGLCDGGATGGRLAHRAPVVDIDVAVGGKLAVAGAADVA